MTPAKPEPATKPRGLDWALRQKTGSHNANHVLVRMGQVGNASHFCFKSIEALARDTEMP